MASARRPGTSDPYRAGALDERPVPRLLAITGASNITGWMPPLPGIIAAAHARGVPVAVDAAQLAPHRPLPAGADFLAWSGHKMYAPFGAGVLVGPRSAFADGDPFLTGVAPWTWSTSMRFCGPRRPNGKKPARPTSSAPWRCTPRSTH
jgi:selenocysteine lyase/cysteine desulfurase